MVTASGPVRLEVIVVAKLRRVPLGHAMKLRPLLLRTRLAVRIESQAAYPRRSATLPTARSDFATDRRALALN